jgi:hypothetical protein
VIKLLCGLALALALCGCEQCGSPKQTAEKLSDEERVAVWRQGYWACGMHVSASVIFAEPHSLEWRNAWIEGYIHSPAASCEAKP